MDVTRRPFSINYGEIATILDSISCHQTLFLRTPSPPFTRSRKVGRCQSNGWQLPGNRFWRANDGIVGECCLRRSINAGLNSWRDQDLALLTALLERLED